MFGFGKKRERARAEELDLLAMSYRDQFREFFRDPDLRLTSFVSGVLWARECLRDMAPVSADEKRAAAKVLYDVSYLLEGKADKADDEKNETAHLSMAFGVSLVGMRIEALSYRETEIARAVAEEAFNMVENKVATFDNEVLGIVRNMAHQAIGA